MSEASKGTRTILLVVFSCKVVQTLFNLGLVPVLVLVKDVLDQGKRIRPEGIAVLSEDLRHSQRGIPSQIKTLP